MEEEDMRSGPETNHKNKSLLLRINLTGHRMVHVVWYGVLSNSFVYIRHL